MPMVVPDIAAENQEDILSRSMRRETPLGEYLGAKLSRGFDWTMTGRVLDNERILRAEEDAYGPAQYQGGISDEVHMAESMAGVDLSETSRPILTEDAWKTSPWYREGIQYDPSMSPVRARLLAENFDNRRYRDSLIERSPSRVGRSALGFGAELLGNLPDPINLLPLGVAGKGLSWGKTLLYGAAENAAVTAAQDALVMPSLRKAGEDVGWEDAALDVIFGAGIGGLFGFVGKGLHDYRVSRLRKRMALQDRDTLGRAMELSLDQAAAGDPVDVASVLRGERERLASLYDEALAEPLGGDPRSPQVRVAFQEIADDLDVALGDVFVDRGQGKQVGDSVLAKTRYGMVKFIFRHGEASDKLPGLQVTRDDVLHFPEIIREFMPTHDPSRGPNSYEWVIRREDGRQVLYAVNRFTDDARDHLTSVHVLYPDREKPLSPRIEDMKKAGGDALSSPSEVGRPIQDTGQADLYSRPPGGEDTPLPASQAISPAEDRVKTDWRPERPETSPVEAEEARRSLLQPETTETGLEDLDAAMARVEDLRKEGRLTPDENDALAMVEDQATRVDRYEEALLSVVECIGRN